MCFSKIFTALCSFRYYFFRFLMRLLRDIRKKYVVFEVLARSIRVFNSNKHDARETLQFFFSVRQKRSFFFRKKEKIEKHKQEQNKHHRAAAAPTIVRPDSKERDNETEIVFALHADGSFVYTRSIDCYYPRLAPSRCNIIAVACAVYARITFSAGRDGFARRKGTAEVLD